MRTWKIMSNRHFGFPAYYRIDPLSEHFHLSLAVGIHLCSYWECITFKPEMPVICFNVQNSPLVTVFNDVATVCTSLQPVHLVSMRNPCKFHMLPKIHLCPSPIFHLNCSLAIIQQLETWDKLSGLKTAAQREHSNKNIPSIYFAQTGRP